MITLALTGTIATGKSTILAQFAALRIPTLNADQVVHELLGSGGAAVEAVGNAFPAARENGVINRKVLGAEVFADEEKLKKLECILHPLVRQKEWQFLRNMRRMGTKMAMVEIPLLFETNSDRRFNVTVTTIASMLLIRQRALKRMYMSEARLRSILKRQTPDHIKRRRADSVIHTGLGKGHSMREVKAVIRGVRKIPCTP